LVEGLKGLGFVRGNVDEAVAAGVHGLFMPHGLGHQMGLDVHDMEDLGQNNVGYNALTPWRDHPSVRHCRMARALEVGMVVTVEPGIYFIPAYIAQWKAEGTAAEFINYARVEEYADFGGIRLEDDLLVTATGNRMLGARRIPITTAEVEEAMRKEL
jgi:Xaa-Pro aminopeptidase